jgi:carboxypeptidase family protein
MNKLLIGLACAIVLAGLAPLCFGQATDGNLVGAVVDASGGMVPSASIVIANVATGVKTEAKTGADGGYRFNNIPVGRYNLTATASGFATATVNNLSVGLNQTLTANVTLQVGSVSATVEVSEAATAIDTTTAQVGSSFEASQIVNLPIIENAQGNFGALQLSLLSSGVSSNGGVGQGTGPSVGGQRPMNNNFMIEGVDNNNKAITGPLVYVPTEATAEFTLLQNQFGAEFGHSTGGQFNTIVKSGSNELHGSLYEYFQNRNLNAVDAQYVNSGIRQLPRFDQNKLGATIGGPIKKDKLFYFGNFEYGPLGQAYTPGSPVSAPTAAGFALLDQMTNLSKTNYSIFKQYVPAAPVANDHTTVNGVSIPIGALPISGSFFNNYYTAIGSVDYNLSERDQIRGRYIWNRSDSLDNNANLPYFWTTLPQRFYLVSLAEYHTFTPNVTNELRLAYNRFSQFYTITGDKFPGLDAFPNLQFDNDLGLQVGPDPNAPQYAIQNTYQLVENINWTKGKHTFKFGFDGRNSISPQHFIQRERGDYDYATIEEFLLDQLPSDQAQRNLGSTSYYGNQWATYLYGNDTWRLKKNLTLNLGMRWERTTVPIGMTLQALNSISNVPGLISFNAPQTFNRAFAPRLGIAYSPGSSGRTSIRAGFGMAYDVIFDNVGSTAYPPQLSSTYDANNYPAIFHTPFLASGGIRPGSLSGGGDLNQADARAATSSYLPNQIPPTSVQWNVGVQHVFHTDYTLEVRYLGSHGYHLITQNRMNIQDKVTADRYLPTYLQAPSQATLDAMKWSYGSAHSAAVTDINSFSRIVPAFANYGFTSAVVGFVPWGSSQYNGLAVQMTRRFARGFQMVGAYTWSHNIDNSTATHFSTILSPRRPQDFRNLGAEKASSALDRRNRLTLSWLWDTPWMKSSSNWAAKNLIGNWRLVGTYTAETGELTTPQSQADANLNGDTVDRTIINPAGLANVGSNVTALKNSAGDTVAYLATNPNARYIKANFGALPNAGRNTLLMPGINNFDLSLAKKFNLTESKHFEVRADASNIFNHAQYTAGYINSVRLTSQITTNIFMQPASAQFAQWSNNFSSNSRTMQLVAKFVF